MQVRALSRGKGTEVGTSLDAALLLALGASGESFAPPGEELIWNVEELTARFVERAIVQRILSAEPAGKRIGENIFLIGGEIFSVRVSKKNYILNNSLGISVIESIQRQPAIVRGFRINGYGQYQQGELCISARLSKYTDEIVQQIKHFYDRSYGWLSERLQDGAEHTYHDVSRHLYKTLRIAFADSPKLADHVWFVAFSNGHGQYVFDQDAAKRMMAELAKNSGHGVDNVSLLFSSLCSARVPLELMFSQHAIRENIPVRGNIKTADYVVREPLYTVAERNIFRGHSKLEAWVDIYPIVTDYPPFLIAGFPSVMGRRIKYTLAQSRDEIASVFRSKFENRKPGSLNVFPGVFSGVGPYVSELAGRYTRGLAGW